MDRTDQDLLCDFADSAAPEAFELLVRRHIDWVDSMAMRLTHGNRPMAEDVTQAVFMLLAKRARSLRHRAVLSSWLFVVTRYCVNNARRRESCRLRHEKEAAAMRSEIIPAPEPEWNELAPMLDEMVGHLRDADQKAVLLRFYQRQSFQQIGEALRISEEAARKRVSRAVEQLRKLFARKGITVGAVALAAMLSANLTHPASAAMVAATAAAPVKLAAGSSIAPLVQSGQSMLAWAGIKSMAAVIVCAISLSAVATVLLQQAGAPQTSVAAPATQPTTVPAAPATFKFGRVVTEDGRPVAGASVRAFVWTELFLPTRPTAPVETDANGQFMLALSGDDNTIFIKAPGHGLGGGELPEWTSATEPGEIRVKPPTSLRVRFVDPDGLPAIGLRVRLAGVGNRSPGSRWVVKFPDDFTETQVQQADAQGVCVFTALPKDGMAILNPLDDRFALMGWEEEFSLRDTDVTDAGTFRLKRAGSISGRVIFADTQKPAAGIKIACRQTWGRDVVSAVTDSEGRYQLKQLLTGTYQVAPFLSPAMSERFATVSRKDVRVTASAPVPNQDFSIVVGGVIRGKVIEKQTLKPIPNMDIFVESPARQFPGFSQDARTHEDGTYAIHVVPGEWRVQFALPMPPGMLEPQPLSRSITIAGSETVDFNFDVPQNPSPRIHGHTVDEQGRALAGVEIMGQMPDGFPPGQTLATSGLDGSFILPGLETGTILRARRGRWGTEKSIPLPAGTELTITLSDNALATVRARIESPDGKPIAGAKVQLVSYQLNPPGGPREGKIYFNERTTAADGTCVFKSVSPDMEYGLAVAARGFGRQEIKFQVEPGAELNVPKIILPKADGFVSGMVVDENGNPQPDVHVDISSERVGELSAMTDSNGQFRIDGLMTAEQVRLDIREGERQASQQAGAGSEGVLIILPPAKP